MGGRGLIRLLVTLTLLDGVVVSGLVPILSEELGERSSLAFSVYFAGVLVGQLLIYAFRALSRDPRIAVVYQLALAGAMAFMAVAPFELGLIVGRGWEGLAAGLVLPLVFDLAARAGPPAQKEQRLAWVNSAFAIGFVSGPLFVEAVSMASSPRLAIGAYAIALVLSALTLLTFAARSALPSTATEGDRVPLGGFDEIFPLFFAKTLYGFSLAFAASHTASHFAPFSMTGLMLVMSVTFVGGQLLGNLASRRAPRAWLIVALPTLAAVLMAVYVSVGVWWLFLFLVLVHSMTVLIAYAGVTGTPGGARAFALFNSASDPGMLLGAALSGLGLLGGAGIVVLGLLPLARAAARPARWTRAEAMIPFIGPVTLAKLLAKQRSPVPTPVDADLTHLNGLTFHAPAPPSDAPCVRLLFGGDLGPAPRPTHWHPALKALIARHDWGVLNLESPIGDAAQWGVFFQLPPDQLDALMGPPTAPLFQAASVVNNHALDQGPAGANQTLQQLRDRATQALTTEPTIVSVGPLRVGLLARTFGSNAFWRRHAAVGVTPPQQLLEDDRPIARALLDEIRALKAQTDLVILSYHWGFEGEYLPSTMQGRAWSVLRDAGVDIVYGHHSHIPQPFGLSEDRAALCLYSCGNLRMEMPEAAVYDQGALFSVEVRRHADGWVMGSVETHWFARDGDTLIPTTEPLARANWLAR